MSKQAPTFGRLATMIVFALSCFGLLLFLWATFGGAVPMGPKGYRVSVDFREATQLAEQADVRISGVPVGKVVKIGESGSGGIRAEIEVRTRYAPLPRDVRATLRQKTLLGETFVELTPGTERRGTIPEGGRIPAGQVQPTVELDEVLRALDEPTRKDLRVLLDGIARGTEGRDGELSDALGSVPPAAEATGGVLAVLSSERDALITLVHDAGTTFGALGRRRAETRALIGGADRVLRTTARRDAELEQTITILPTFLRELRRTLRSAEGASADAAPVLRALRPAAPLVPGVLRDTNALLPSLNGLVDDLDPALTAAGKGLPAASRTVDAAREAMPILHTTARDLRPVVTYLGLYRHELMAAFMNVAAATQDTFKQPGAREALHYLRVLIPVTGEGRVDQPRRLPTNRHNAYFKPRALDRLAQGLESFGCGHLGNPPTAPVIGSSPATCTEQKPWSFDGGPPRAFHRLTRDPPQSGSR
jgi:phospholipid/cholesterol/gamma-HCH transport system substrate-binding protein